MDGYSRLLLTECASCGDPVLVGTVAGLRIRIDRMTVPRSHAEVLRRYGVSVYVVDRRAGGLHADFWDLGTHELTKTGRHLVVPHVCGAVHARYPNLKGAA